MEIVPTENDKVITVAELIELLKEVDPNLPIKVEGCDCYGEGQGISIYDNYCLIRRYTS